MKKIFTIAIVAIAFGMLAYGMIPSKAVIEGGLVKFSGMYGVELNLSEIETVQLIDQIPKVNSRTNGLSLLGVKKGFFSLEDHGKSRLLIQSSNPPFILFTTKGQETIICNFRDPMETKSLFEKIGEGI